MSSTLLFAAPALRDLDALFDSIAEDSLARAARFILRIARCERLETFPRSGRARPGIWVVCAPFLVWPVVVFYRVDGDFVIVALSVKHFVHIDIRHALAFARRPTSGAA
jgi:plasmid stabilization system protein ParE